MLHSSQGLTSSIDSIEIPTIYQSALTNNESLEKLVIMAEVEVDENDLPISPNATSYGHMKGSLVRTLVPISYKTWKHVPDKYKNYIWNELQVQISSYFCSHFL